MRFFVENSNQIVWEIGAFLIFKTDSKGLAAFPIALALPFLEFLHEFSTGFVVIQAHPINQ